MPLYEYKCNECQKKIEVIQRISDPPYTHCPSCGGEVKKVISAPAIQFKGSGFYKTDYASPSKGGSESKSETKAETKSESKTESKSDTKSSE